MTPAELELAKLQLQQNQLYLQAVLGLITALIGIGGVYFGQVAVRRSATRKALDDFWYQYAVTEGTIPVIDYLSNLHLRLAKAVNLATGDDDERVNAESFDTIQTVQIPLTAMNRLITLLETYIVSEQTALAESVLMYSSGVSRLPVIHERIARLQLMVSLIHTMFIVSTVTSRGQISITGQTPAVKEFLTMYEPYVKGEAKLDAYHAAKVRSLIACNIFATEKERRTMLENLAPKRSMFAGLKSALNHDMNR